jgi:hypothetical protein
MSKHVHPMIVEDWARKQVVYELLSCRRLINYYREAMEKCSKKDERHNRELYYAAKTAKAAFVDGLKIGANAMNAAFGAPVFEVLALLKPKEGYVRMGVRRRFYYGPTAIDEAKDYYVEQIGKKDVYACYLERLSDYRGQWFFGKDGVEKYESDNYFQQKEIEQAYDEAYEMSTTWAGVDDE